MTVTSPLHTSSTGLAFPVLRQCPRLVHSFADCYPPARVRTPDVGYGHCRLQFTGVQLLRTVTPRAVLTGRPWRNLIVSGRLRTPERDSRLLAPPSIAMPLAKNAAELASSLRWPRTNAACRIFSVFTAARLPLKANLGGYLSIALTLTYLYRCSHENDPKDACRGTTSAFLRAC